ncbi:MAG: hypothetical protein FJ035_02725 [Chloroflexi bacterium]|nr:hypothetical protein [Chloroflexota bacterium]
MTKAGAPMMSPVSAPFAPLAYTALSVQPCVPAALTSSESVLPPHAMSPNPPARRSVPMIDGVCAAAGVA